MTKLDPTEVRRAPQGPGGMATALCGHAASSPPPLQNTPTDSQLIDPRDVEATLVYDAYLAAVAAGQPFDPDRLLADHPSLADRLQTLLATGQRLAAVAGDAVPDLDDYQVLRTIGRGGMGIVYEAEQRSRHRLVAVKVLTAAAAIDPQLLDRFLKVEVPAASLLHHPHIVPILDHGCQRGFYFHAMPLIDGQNLAQWIKTQAETNPDAGAPANARSSSSAPKGHDPLAQPNGLGTPPTHPYLPQSPAGAACRQHRFHQAARWAQHAAEALHFAHQQGVVHRDIKPSNLLIDARGHVWISDFGLAQIRGEAGRTATGESPGTPRYMSPEQVRARRIEVDHRTDVYSLGATLYELLTLRPAFDGDDGPQEILRRVVEEEPPPPRRVDPTIPRDLETIVLKAMAKDREDRYATANDLAKDLQRYVDAQPIQARRLNVLDHALRWSSRNRRTVAAAVSLLAAALVVLSVLVLWIAGAERRALAAKVKAEQESRVAKAENSLQEIIRRRLSPHASGWSRLIWRLVETAAENDPPDRAALQAQAAEVCCAAVRSAVVLTLFKIRVR